MQGDGRIDYFEFVTVPVLQVSSEPDNIWWSPSYCGWLVLERWRRSPFCMGVALSLWVIHVEQYKMYLRFKFHKNRIINGRLIQFIRFCKDGVGGHIVWAWHFRFWHIHAEKRKLYLCFKFHQNLIINGRVIEVGWFLQRWRRPPFCVGVALPIW